jgi:hypothetical protein
MFSHIFLVASEAIKPQVTMKPAYLPDPPKRSLHDLMSFDYAVKDREYWTLWCKKCECFIADQADLFYTNGICDPKEFRAYDYDQGGRGLIFSSVGESLKERLINAQPFQDYVRITEKLKATVAPLYCTEMLEGMLAEKPPVGYQINQCPDAPHLVGLYVINYNRYRLDFDYENLAVVK